MNSYKVTFLFLIIIVAIDTLVIFLAPEICPETITAEFMKAFSIQIFLIIFTFFFKDFKKIALKFKKFIGIFFLLGLIFLLSSFSMLWIGKSGVHTYGGQNYCSLNEIPSYMKP